MRKIIIVVVSNTHDLKVVLSIDRIFISIIGPKTKKATIALVGKILDRLKAKNASTFAHIETINARSNIARIAKTGSDETDKSIERGIIV
jgi:hypothetical protein